LQKYTINNCFQREFITQKHENECNDKSETVYTVARIQT